LERRHVKTEINMLNSTPPVEQHGCIVCGKLYNLLVVYDSVGRVVDCKVTSPGGKCIPDERPLVACERHTQEEIKHALATHYPGKAIEDLEDEK
jgi:hypothetical protein